MSKATPILRLFEYAKGDRLQLIWASFCSITNKLFDIAPEILIGIAIDVVVSKEQSFVSRLGWSDPWEQILVLAVLTFFIWFGESLFEYLLLINWRNLAQKIQHQLRIDTYRHIQKLDLSYFEDQSTGSLVSILNDDVNQLERFLDGGANQLLQTFTAVAGVGAVFFVISYEIALIAFMPIPIVILGAFYFQRRATPLYATVRDKVGLLSSRLNNNISGIITIKSFTSEDKEAETLEEQSLDYLRSNSKAIAMSSAFIPIIRMAILAGFLATFTLGAWKVLNGQLAVGSYGVLVFLTQRLLWPLTGLAATVDLYERAMASTRRILNLMNTPISLREGHLRSDHLRGHFKFENVDFRYASGAPVLKGLQFEILPKKTTAFVGATGSGKSTLIKLLLRFYEPTRGNIQLDGHPLSDFHTHSLRGRIGLVSQDVFLFHGTVRENILYGRPEASEEDIRRACQLAEAHDFIQNLPEKYDTLIGERGQKLSGGQRQRLSIARALLKNPDILIFDEATSAVDNETEAAIQRSLSIISKNRTIIVVAHRLSTIVSADKIFVLENGEIKESGHHRDLILQKNGAYSRLWQVQTGSGITPPS